MRVHRVLAAGVFAAGLCNGALAQPVPIDDEKIHEAVEDALRYARSLAAARIEVQAREGYVTLTGVASTKADIVHAGRLTARVRGVTGIDNRIRIADRPPRG